MYLCDFPSVFQGGKMSYFPSVPINTTQNPPLHHTKQNTIPKMPAGTGRRIPPQPNQVQLPTREELVKINQNSMASAKAGAGDEMITNNAIQTNTRLGVCRLMSSECNQVSLRGGWSSKGIGKT